MKLCELFSCCLPVQKKKHRNERVDTSNKKKRKEAKHFKKEMADRRRKETLEMDISKVQSVETVVVSLDEVKNGPAERLEGEYAVIAIHHAEMANARPVSRPRAEKENISEPNQETSKEDCILIESSVDHGTPQLDEGGGRSPSPLHVDGDGHREFSKEDCNTKKSSVDYGTPQLDEGDGKNPTPLHGGGDGAGPVPRLKLDWHKYQLTVGKPTAQAGAWRTADTPEEKDVMEEERVKILHGFFERRGITTQNTTTQTTLTTEEEKPTPQSAVWHTKIPEERNEEKRKILHGFVKRRGLTACRPRREFNTQLNG
ncbi:uncharacterized protein LOC125291140 isoform X2 [Alosa alosa]|uniref:uncharacterized protein LOC125291140 isoform X2 n=1 Tax=Alosa alosa TaxID=278164 RepID=UPI0020154995|nr:uncharacterized protein LOC125291140 isoform X2 [Alosa alosa]